MNFSITGLLGIPLGWVMWVCYYIIGSYGIALFLFTLITRAAMFPMTLKQQKSMGKMALIQPKITEIQTKYKNNKEKQNEEMMKLYQEEGYNPMSGCLPMVVQFPILFGLIDVIYRPLKHILRLPADVIEKATEILESITGQATNPNMVQLDIVSQIHADPGQFEALGEEIILKIQSLNLNFLGMNLTDRPSMSMLSFTNFNPVVLIPILAGVSALAMSLVTMKSSANQNSGGAGMKGMMLFMPILSAWFAFSVSAGVGLYWIYSNIIGIIQHFVMNKIYNPKEMAEKARIEMEERKERERLERIEARKAAREAAKAAGKEEEEYVPQKKGLTAKEISRQKLAEARRRDAEKYGEEYVEVTDDDLL